MSVVCRMHCNSTKATVNGTEIDLSAVYTADTNDPHYDEIKEFFDATPQAKLTAFINNEKAAEQFQPGDEFYVSLEKIRSAK